MTARPAARPPARCLALLNRLSRYLDHELTPKQRRAIDAHCRDCGRCQRMIAGLRRTVALYRREGSAAMPAGMRARARARVARLLGTIPRTSR
jgi:anti-sigma factor RsiW